MGIPSILWLVFTCSTVVWCSRFCAGGASRLLKGVRRAKSRIKNSYELGHAPPPGRRVLRSTKQPASSESEPESAGEASSEEDRKPRRSGRKPQDEEAGRLIEK